MEKTLVIIDKSGPGNYSRVAIKNQVKDEWVSNEVMHNSTIADMLEMLLYHTSDHNEPNFKQSQADTLIMMQASHPCFIELKNKRYKIKTVAL